MTQPLYPNDPCPSCDGDEYNEADGYCSDCGFDLYEDENMKTVAHPDYDWRDAQAPNWPAETATRTTGRLRSCGYCGSMHPEDLFAALQAGATAHWADFKYGWPHKLYVEGIPNPHAGMLESREGRSDPSPQDIASGKYLLTKTGRFNPGDGQPEYFYYHKGEPAKPLTNGKFYTEHLQDATPEQIALIEKHMGFAFTFEKGRVRWEVLFAKAPTAA